MPLYIDRTSLPLLRLRYVGKFTDADLGKFLHELEAILALPGRKAAVFDLTEAGTGSPTQRQTQAAWIGKHESVLARDFAAAAIVTDSAIIRGAVTALFWLRPLPFPTHVTATAQLAEEWLAPYLASLQTS